MSKRSFLSSVLLQKCPRCRQGDMFKYPAYDLKKFNILHEKCSECGQKFDLEPGFYTGAMYVSYAFQVALVVSVMVAFYVLKPDASILIKSIVLIVLAVGLLPVVLRVSKTLYIHFFVSYRGG